MKQKRLTFAIAAVLTGSPMLVTAGPVILPNADGSIATTVSTWTKELKRDDTAVTIVNGSLKNITLETSVGFGFPSGQNRFIRLDLQGAKFKGAPTCATTGYTVHSTLTALTGATCESRTGGNGSNFATFKISATADVVSNGSIRFDITTAGGGLTPTGSGDEIKVTYSLHNNDVSADAANQANAGGILDKKTGTYVAFKPLVSVEATPQLPITADVGQAFTGFVVDSVTNAGHGPIGFFKYAAPSNIFTVNDMTTPTDSKVAQVSDVISASTLTVTGDFTSTRDFTGTTVLETYSTAVTRVYLDTTGAAAPAKPCDTTSVPATTVTATSATFNLGTAPTGEKTYICIKPNGISPVSPSTYNMAVAFTPKTGYIVESYAFDNVGEIRQNGTVIDTPYLTVNAGYISRVIFTNTGNKEAPYTATIVTDSGATATPGAAATGTIPAGANLQINATDLVAFSAKPRGAVRFVVTAPNTAIQAVYQTVNLKSLDVQSVSLNRRGGGDGK